MVVPFLFGNKNSKFKIQKSKIKMRLTRKNKKTALQNLRTKGGASAEG